MFHRYFFVLLHFFGQTRLQFLQLNLVKSTILQPTCQDIFGSLKNTTEWVWFLTECCKNKTGHRVAHFEVRDHRLLPIYCRALQSIGNRLCFHPLHFHYRLLTPHSRHLLQLVFPMNRSARQTARLLYYYRGPVQQPKNIFYSM